MFSEKKTFFFFSKLKKKPGFWKNTYKFVGSLYIYIHVRPDLKWSLSSKSGVYILFSTQTWNPYSKSFQWEHHPRTREKNVVFDGRRQEEVPNPLRMGYPTTHGFGQFYGSESSIFDFGGWPFWPMAKSMPKQPQASELTLFLVGSQDVTCITTGSCIPIPMLSQNVEPQIPW